MRFSVLIPTYNRPTDLLTCIDTIVAQSAVPAQCIIVDDGDLSEEVLARAQQRLAGAELTYYKKNHAIEPRGQSVSKNIGLRLSVNDIVFVLDDDVLLEQDYFSYCMEVWHTLDGEHLMGVGGAITNLRSRSRLERLYNSIFALTARNGWDVNDIGFQVWDERIERRTRAYYMHGGLCSLKKSKALEFSFKTFKAGRSALEDVDFCMRAKKAGFYFYIEPRARALHKSTPASRDAVFEYGVKESVNRRQIFQDNVTRTPRHVLWFYWASVGWILRQFLAGNLRKGTGLLFGMFAK